MPINHIEQSLLDLDNCQKALIGIKTNYEPMYRNLLLFWTQRRNEIKKQLGGETCFQ